jgi:4-hydroxybutyrate dehydrogenase / sulfolactaldehyde 3-reductase
MNNVRRIGFVGLGTMGLPMAENLVKAGFQVIGFDISKDARRAFKASGALASNCAEAAREADLVITMLPNASHVRSVLFGPNGAAEVMSPSAVFINMSTILPQDTDAIAAEMRLRGLRMLDAPVGRSAIEAKRGALLILASGDSMDVERARAALLAMGNQIVDCGPVGGGSRAKIVNNFMGISLNALTGEALALAEAAGISIELALNVMRGTIAGFGHMNVTYPNKVLRGDLSAGFAVDLAHKDLGLAIELAAQSHVPVFLGSAALQVYSVAKSMGRGAQDYTAIYPVIRALAGLPDKIPYEAKSQEEFDPFSKPRAAVPEASP